MTSQLTVEYDVPATMRDGTVLRANVVRPADGGPYPVALCRTPYGKDFAAVSPLLDSLRLARAGYIVVIQDVRGRFASEGQWQLMRHEYDDGYDTVEWAAQLPGSTGAVGMFGASYVGFTQWAAAVAAPPSLRALVPAVTWARGDDGLLFRGGAFELGSAAAWQLAAIGPDALLRRMRGAPPEEIGAALWALAREIDALRPAGYQELPLAAFPPLQRAGVGEEFSEHIAARQAPPFTSPFAAPEDYGRVAAPALIIGGWYDIFVQGSLDTFLGVRARGATPEARSAELLIGPWTHSPSGSAVGELDFGIASTSAFINLETDLTGLTQRWFDRWLKGQGEPPEHPVRVFVLGANQWRALPAWPPPAEQTELFLQAGGALGREPGAGEPDRYTYDPADPTPTRGGNLLLHELYVPGAADQRPVEARADVLSYTGAPLDADTEVAGRVTARLWVASDAPDTDFVARLVDVHPDGFAQPLADGIVRMSAAGLAPLVPGQPYEITVDMWSVANVFRAGHRIRLDVASASFPRWDRALNTLAPRPTLEDARPAAQAVFHDAERPSRLVLPVVTSVTG